ncbi:MAG: hypothetical protein QW128_07290 [Thermoprotei archaeon]
MKILWIKHPSASKRVDMHLFRASKVISNVKNAIIALAMAAPLILNEGTRKERVIR